MTSTSKQPSRAQLDRYACFLWNEHRALSSALGYISEGGIFVPLVAGAQSMSWETPPASRCLPVLKAVGLLPLPRRRLLGGGWSEPVE